MPNLDDHCKHTIERYGIDGRDIHSWMDEPCKIFGPSHRTERHDAEGIKDAMRIFAKKYTATEIKKITIDHILYDIENRSDDREYSMISNPIAPLPKEQLLIRRRIEKELQVMEIRTKNIQDFLKIKYLNVKKNQFKNAYHSLLEWEGYVLGRSDPNSPIKLHDVADYAFNLSNGRIEPRTAARNLYYLELFFKYYGELELSSQANEEKRKFIAQYREADKNKKPVPIRDIVALYRYAKPQIKLILSLSLFDRGIKITDFSKIRFEKMHDGTYKFSIDGLRKKLHPMTEELAQTQAKSKASKGEERLLGITRSINKQISNYGNKIGLTYDLTPFTFRKFAEHQDMEELTSMLKQAS